MNMKAEQFIEVYRPHMSEYCSAVIDAGGELHACKVSHLRTMIELYGDPEILSKIPEGKSPLFWLVIRLECVLVDYENQVYSEKINPLQEHALKLLEEKGLIKKNRKDIHGNC